VAGLIVAAGVSLVWCFGALWLGPRIGYVDKPDGSVLKVHEKPAVPLGGVGIYAGFHLAVLAEGVFDLTLFVATTIVLVLGLLDDRWGLPPLIRLGVEVAAAAFLMVGLDGPAPGLGSFIGGVIVIVFAINAVNLFDGLDGLASSIGLVAAIGVALLATQRGIGQFEDSLALAAALAGFLVLGWHPARVFLGDSGAYVLGMLLAAGIIGTSVGNGELAVGSALLGVYAIDLVVTIVRRVRARAPLFEGDRSHVYDQLRDRGWGVTKVVYMAAAAQALVVALVLLVDRLIPGWAGAGVLAVLGFALLGLLAARGFLVERVEGEGVTGGEA
jgi:UDP-GlcNAc:undecaprenyl-phosphate GlcNAc-1-phosphate transferase